MSDEIPFTPDYLSMSRAMFDRFPRVATAADNVFGLRVHVNPAVPDDLIFVVGPPKDPDSEDPLEALMPQVVVIKLEHPDR